MLAKWWWRDRTELEAKWRKVVQNCNAMPVTRRGGGVWSTICNIEKDLGNIGINLLTLMCPKADGTGWEWHLDSTRKYTVSSLRKLIDAVSLPSDGRKTDWIRWLPNKANILLWRVRINRLATRDNLARRGVAMPSNVCPMCLSSTENLDHVMANCSTSKVVGAYMTSWVDWWPVRETTVEGFWSSLNAIGGDNITKEVRKVIGTAFFWNIWIHRNNTAFNSCVKKEIEIFRNTQFLAFEWIRCRSKSGNLLTCLSKWQSSQHHQIAEKGNQVTCLICPSDSLVTTITPLISVDRS
ncbi:hypothetical protein OSB04_030139 [Centaurea solstitialis]|uniref:Reverse transcriptase zinc-binding domain-containing protein n=1 Tax=Centaurea solstitialis TaxID=347529 RepID=A0AA38SK22_9ASTR|nr:hypothetical protein OSB04_030139 [Centaurea solstitialis]